MEDSGFDWLSHPRLPQQDIHSGFAHKTGCHCERSEAIFHCFYSLRSAQGTLESPGFQYQPIDANGAAASDSTVTVHVR